MERLTERLENGVINVKYASQHETAIHRLVTIEDILGEEYDLDKLMELVQAKREGRCIVLPCKIGSTLYRIQRFRRGKNWKKEAEFIRTVELNRNNFWRIVMDGEIGETVFLARAEAEEALRREQDGN